MRGRGGRGGGRGGRGGSSNAGSAASELSVDIDAPPASLVLQSRAQPEKPPERYPPMRNFPTPAPLSLKEKLAVDKARFFSEHFTYSGYHIPIKKRSKMHERYSDRYRRIVGKRDIFDEIKNPSNKIFPRELLSKADRRRSTAPDYASLYGFWSVDSLMDSAEALVKVTGKAEVNERLLLEEAERREKAGIEEERAEDDEEEQEYEEEEDDEDLIGGGDYTENYGDDDEDNDGAFGDDDGDTM